MKEQKRQEQKGYFRTETVPVGRRNSVRVTVKNRQFDNTIPIKWMIGK
jgi:hypothetical protein